MKWTSEFPTDKNVGQWFFVKQDRKDWEYPIIKLYEIRKDDHLDNLYLCEPCNQGFQAMSFGVMLKLFNKDQTTFCGPIDMPSDYAESRKKYYNSKSHKAKIGSI